MASPTKQTWAVRDAKRAKQQKERSRRTRTKLRRKEKDGVLAADALRREVRAEK